MTHRNSDEPPGHQAARLACAVALNSVAARAVSPRMPRAKGGEGSSKPYDDAAEMDMDEVGELEWYMFSASEIGDVNLEVSIVERYSCIDCLSLTSTTIQGG